MGADAIRRLLKKLDLVHLPDKLRGEMATTGSKQRQKELSKRLKVIESLRDSQNSPDWMVLEVVPVIPRIFVPSCCSIAATSRPAI